MRTLYHGTSERHLDSILREGIKPRGRKRGNWKSYPSIAGHVYLTSAYAGYFATVAAKKGERALIVEVCLEDDSRLYPDEDFIAQALAAGNNRPIDDYHGEVSKTIAYYRDHVQASLDGLGNVSHGGVVPPSAISRYVLVDTKKQLDVIVLALDPTISLLNYKFCGERYRSINSWLFGDRSDFPLGFAGQDNDSYISLLERSQEGYRDHVAKMFANREGIEVVDVQKAVSA
jgi:hypothetical protein